MTEIEILETAIGLIRKGDLLQAAEVLHQSENPQTRENGDNCERLSRSPNALLQDTLLVVLEQQLGFERTFGDQ